MIRFSLHCDQDHDFEAWFASGTDYERQANSGLLSCPQCGSVQIDKTVMAPSVSTARNREQNQAVAMVESQAVVVEKVREMVRAIRAASEDVGEEFPEEARKIHYGEAEARGIVGSASHDDVKSLLEEGIGILPLPQLPEDTN